MSATIQEDNEYPKCESCGCQGGPMLITEDLVHYSSQFDMWLCDFCKQQKWRQLHEENTSEEELSNTTRSPEKPY